MKTEQGYTVKLIEIYLQQVKCLSYNGIGQLNGITDAFNRTLTITPNANGTVQQISDSIGIVATYDYFPSTTLLKTVTYADGSKYKFEYTTISGKTYLATVKDALDNILETHQYDTNGRAWTSEKQGGVEKYTLDYTYANDTLAYTSNRRAWQNNEILFRPGQRTQRHHENGRFMRLWRKWFGSYDF